MANLKVKINSAASDMKGGIVRRESVNLGVKSDIPKLDVIKNNASVVKYLSTDGTFFLAQILTNLFTKLYFNDRQIRKEKNLCNVGNRTNFKLFGCQVEQEITLTDQLPQKFKKMTCVFSLIYRIWTGIHILGVKLN